MNRRKQPRRKHAAEFDPSLMDRVAPVQIKIQFQDMNARLPQKAQLAAFGVGQNNCPQFGFSDAPSARDTRDLEIGGSGRNIGIESRPGCGDKINRHGNIGIFGVEFLNAGCNAVKKGPICWRKVGTAGCT